ncbi:MAG: DUF3047 domain-containing protein [Deltaproteobacteria bacterium]|nr:DUF3047 domain-containing protein [Deltaproteobacteria bacterium]NIS77193.1 DUF3047 domain-containing protein [Deltaproteobacteria bacterium]
MMLPPSAPPESLSLRTAKQPQPPHDMGSNQLRRRVLTALAALFLTLAFSLSLSGSETRATGFRDDFNDLANWKPYHFANIEKHSTYTTGTDGETTFLRLESDGSASAIMWKDTFNVYEYPFARWRWKIEKVYEKGDARSKGGDDYPVRVYLIFKKRVLFGLVSLPTSLNYVWANRSYDEKIIPNAYTERSMMVLLQEGGQKAGQWITEEVNIVQDYLRAFGKNPPETATIAIMNDSDNTKESSVSYIDFIEILDK